MRAVDGFALTNQAAVISEAGVAALGVGDIFEQGIVGFAVVGDIQAQLPSRDDFRATAVERVCNGREVPRNVFSAGLVEIAFCIKSVPIGEGAVLFMVVGFGVVDSAKKVSGKTTALIFAAERWSEGFLRRSRKREHEEKMTEQIRDNDRPAHG